MTEKTIIAHTKYDRRIKLSDTDKENIKTLHEEGVAIREITRRYKVSRRLIQFVLFPERQLKNISDRKERGGSKLYYDREKHTKSMREYRRYKRKLKLENKI